MKTINKITLTAAVLFGFVACDKIHEGQLINDKAVRINAFQANGIEGSIDEQNQSISLYLPWSADLSRLSTTIAVPEGATTVPAAGANSNLSAPTQYRVLNGNLYTNYTVRAYHPQIEQFAIGKYKASIDHSTGKIKVKYPAGEPINALVPTYSTNTNVAVSPAQGITQNFTQSVTYTMSFRGESFSYTAEVIPTVFPPIAFVGTAATASAISNADERAAYRWLTNTYDTAKYVSFSDIKNGNVQLSDFKVIWWHLDTVGTDDLPADATDATVIAKIKDYYTAGGSLLLTSWAGQYATKLGIVLNGKAVNEKTNSNKAPEEVDDEWGISFKGNETHPLFKELNTIAGQTNAAYLLSKKAKRRDHNTIWNLDKDEYKGKIAQWQTETGAKLLASYHWDGDMKFATIYEYEKQGNAGRTICIGIGSYDWYNEDNSVPNTYKSNIETLTANAIEYLSN